MAELLTTISAEQKQEICLSCPLADCVGIDDSRCKLGRVQRRILSAYSRQVKAQRKADLQARRGYLPVLHGWPDKVELEQPQQPKAREQRGYTYRVLKQRRTMLRERRGYHPELHGPQS